LTERLQKVLARAGLGSRREIEGWIRDRRVSVDGQTAVIGQQVTPQSRFMIDGRTVKVEPNPAGLARTLLYHKPVGQICSRHDPQGRTSVFDGLPRLRGRRWVSVGRLDINTSGLMVFTTDGELAHRLMHPSGGIEREYRCRVRGNVRPADLQRLDQGVRLDGQLCRFESIQAQKSTGSNRWYQVVLREGRYREVRRMWGSIGATVSRLIRVRYGPFQLEQGLRSGQYRELTPSQHKRLYRFAQTDSQVKRPSHSKRSQAQTPAAKKPANKGQKARRSTLRGKPRARGAKSGA
jgi:23S rRNA pseudouridine2605 synthase|tara:strand:- start:1626 stop:2504 length:879 start_codon:yes stop_codon:yes gene_type:complete